MAYSKLFLPCQDFPVGIGFVNAAADNNQALHDIYDAEHVAPGTVLGGPGFRPPGKHDTIKVARAVAAYTVESPFGGAVSYLTCVRPAAGVAPLGASGLGRWDFRCERLGLMAAIATPERADGLPAKATCLVTRINNGLTGLTVQTWVRYADSSQFEAAEMDFTLTVWAAL